MVKHLKRIISIITVITLMCVSISAAQAAGSYFLNNGFYFGVQEDEAYIHGTDGTGWDIIIPETFLDYYVTSIEKNAFFENQSIETLSFYEAFQLKSLGDNAFSYCPKLKKVHITESISEMGVGVFEGCASLSYVRFRDGALTDIPAQSFYGCGKLTNVVFDNEITSIGNLAFANCSSLTGIDIPDSVTSIADNAFSGCDSIVLGCSYGSYALEYAQSHNIDYFIKDALLGDFNCDGVVNINDVTYIQLYRVGLYDISFTGKYTGEVTNDGSVTLRDATAIQLNLVGNGFDNVGKPISALPQ